MRAPEGITLDVINNKMYCTQSQQHYMDISHTTPTLTATTVTLLPLLTRYVADSGADCIYQADLAGKGLTKVVTNIATPSSVAFVTKDCAALCEGSYFESRPCTLDLDRLCECTWSSHTRHLTSAPPLTHQAHPNTVGEPPNPPRDPAVVFEKVTATLTWLPPLPNAKGRPLTHYLVKISTTGKPNRLETVPISSLADPAKPQLVIGRFYPNTQYMFAVAAVSQAGQSEYTPGILATSGECGRIPGLPNCPGRPDPPTNVVAKAEQNGILVRWVPPANDGGAPVESYTVLTKPDELETTVTGEFTTEALVTLDLKRGQKYTFYVYCTTWVAKSKKSEPSNLVVIPTFGAIGFAPATYVVLNNKATAQVTVSRTGDPFYEVTVDAALYDGQVYLEQVSIVVCVCAWRCNICGIPRLTTLPSPPTRPRPFVGSLVMSL